MAERRVKTVLVEDHEITRLGLKKMLEQIPEVEIVAEESSGKAAVAKVIELQPDLVLMDIGLPDIDGLEATRMIKESVSSIIIVITSHDNDEDVLAALGAGADAYCLKGITASQLANAISSVMDGAVWLDPLIAKQIVRLASAGPAAKPQLEQAAERNPFQLSERERQILQLLVEGSTNLQMAEKLFLSPETIKTHMRHIMEKLRVSDRTQAAVKAVREGLVPGVLKEA